MVVFSLRKDVKSIMNIHSDFSMRCQLKTFKLDGHFSDDHCVALVCKRS